MFRRFGGAVPRILRSKAREVIAETEFRATSAVRAAYRDPEVLLHRPVMNLSEKRPFYVHMNCFVAPNASIVGDVFVVDYAQIMYGAVLRGDNNKISVGAYTVIGENTVVNTVREVDTGFKANVDIGNYAIIGPGCTIISSRVGHMATIGAGSVIGEGSIINVGAKLDPGSVVPPGTYIPEYEHWGGNPVAKLGENEVEMKSWVKERKGYYEDEGIKHLYEFQPLGNAYCHLEEQMTKSSLSAPSGDLEESV